MGLHRSSDLLWIHSQIVTYLAMLNVCKMKTNIRVSEMLYFTVCQMKVNLCNN